jgi:Na+/H+ antiporter NhaD/arsenite permease-like protein
MTHELSAPGLPAAVAVLKNALLVEYVPFITLLFSLYVISGGILIEGELVGRPKLNAGLIGLGGVLASLIGTTGAAMLLIRPLLKANARREHVAHTVVFFIFVVCNTGGCLLRSAIRRCFWASCGVCPSRGRSRCGRCGCS